MSGYAVWTDKNFNRGAGIDYRSCIANALKRNGVVVFALPEVDVVVTLDFRPDCRFEQERLAGKWSHLRKLVGLEDLPATTWPFLKRPILELFQLPAQSSVDLINAVKCMIAQRSVEPTISDANSTLYTCFVFGTGNSSCLKIELIMIGQLNADIIKIRLVTIGTDYEGLYREESLFRHFPRIDSVLLIPFFGILSIKSCLFI